MYYYIHNIYNISYHIMTLGVFSRSGGLQSNIYDCVLMWHILSDQAKTFRTVFNPEDFKSIDEFTDIH